MTSLFFICFLWMLWYFFIFVNHCFYNIVILFSIYFILHCCAEVRLSKFSLCSYWVLILLSSIYMYDIDPMEFSLYFIFIGKNRIDFKLIVILNNIYIYFKSYFDIELKWHSDIITSACNCFSWFSRVLCLSSPRWLTFPPFTIRKDKRASDCLQPHLLRG